MTTQRIKVEDPSHVPSGVFCSPDKRTLYVSQLQKGHLATFHKKCDCTDCGWTVHRDGVEYLIDKSDWIPCLVMVTEAKDVPEGVFRTPEGSLHVRLDKETVRVYTDVPQSADQAVLRVDGKYYCIPYRFIPVVCHE